jgi:DNA-binding PadR family transcriptional regulator
MEEPDHQLGTTSCVILGLVDKRPMSGYDLAGLAARSVDHFWPISKSQIYAELGRLERDGYITGTHVEQDRKPDKRSFELTAAGEEALGAWLGSPGYPSERSRNGLLAKLFFAERMTDAQRIALLSDYRDRRDRYRRELQAVVDKLEGRNHAAYGRATALYGLRQAEASVAWADDMLGALGRAAGPVVGSRDPR